MTPKPVHKRYRILVVDDHDICVRHALAALETSTSEIRAAYTASEAIGLGETWLPDVICIDLHLKDSEGIEVIRKIRLTWPDDRPTPKIIVLSGDGAGISPQDMANFDVDCSLVKPVSGRQLRQLTGVDDSSSSHVSNTEEYGTQLYGLFLDELNQRIPRLDQYFARLDLEKITDILHQLIASAAIVREFRFETELRSLSASCRNGDTNQELAARYHTVLESARKLLSQV